MESFLFLADYDKQIQADNLTQIIGSKQAVLDSIQLAAVEECRSYLVQKYDVSKALSPISQHNSATIYNAEKTVYLNATAYSATATYALGALVLQAGNVYRCTTAIITPEAFNASKWTLINPQYTIYNAVLPQPLFDYETIYKVGDKVFYKNKVYTCVIATQILNHEAQLQIGYPTSPIVNVFPDDTVKGLQYWGVGVSYSVPVNTLITNTTYWAVGDNRDQKLLQICIDIALYHAHCRIAPQNIPAMRVIRYMGSAEDRISVYNSPIQYPTYSSLGWLQSASRGEITPNLPKLQPKSGQRIRFGGKVKLNNTY